MLRAISRVASPCCSIAVEMLTVISLICAMVWVMPLIAATASLVEDCIAATWARDFFGGLGGLVGQRLHLGGDHRKAAAGFAGARRFDGGVQRQQVGLRGDRVDQFDHLADLLGAGRQHLHGGVGALGIAHRLAGDLARARHLPGNLGDRARQLFRRGRDRADIVGGVLGRGPDGGGARAGVARGCRHRLRRGLHARRRRRHRTDDAVDAALEIVGEAFHRRAALGRGPLLGLRLGLFQPADAHGIVLEDLDGGGHRADLVAAADAGNVAFQLAIGQRLMRSPSRPSGRLMLRPISQAMLPEMIAMPRIARPSSHSIGFSLASRSSR